MDEHSVEATRQEADAPPRSRGRRWYADPALMAVIPAVLVLDQLTKALVRGSMRLGESWPAEGFVRLTYGTNTGSAFGLFPNQTGLLIVASIIATGFLVVFYRAYSPPSPLLRLAIGLMLGGAVGNLVDRLRVGAVVDFIDVGPWPIFNLADSAVVVGMALLAAAMLTGRMEMKRDGGDAPPEDAPR